MRTSITLTSNLVLLLAAIATIPSVTKATPCEDCIYAGIYATSPTCDAQIFTNPFQGGPMSERQKSCFCPLASSDTWLQQCVTPELCTTQDVNDQYGGFQTLKAEACSNAVPGNNTTSTSPTVPTTPTSSTKPPSITTATSTSSGTKSTPTGAGVRLSTSSNLAAIAVVAVVGALL
ncbi:hypothetical protein EC957_005383 [Mortierella hygrophila]|uniref:Uncharacterized protein n=1 Tax=Mortierella hygrophila TaxID=979708 RepID=A0A9P6F0W9_9FUNG|nr:hypothetical protein EC957_005383 [Mortierella hygrophila]